MMLGYYDAKRLLYGLSGRWYYIDAPYSESYYFERMMTEVKELLSFWAETEEGWDREELEGYRIYTEKIFPFMAKKMNLRENWDYKDLYLSMLETLARKKRINRFHIYTVDQLKDLIVRRYQTNSENRGGMHP